MLSNICYICNRPFHSSTDASNCFYSHDNYVDFYLTKETSLDIQCQKSIEDTDIETLMIDCHQPLRNLSDSLIDDPITFDHQEFSQKIAKAMIAMQKIIFLFDNEENYKKYLT